MPAITAKAKMKPSFLNIFGLLTTPRIRILDRSYNGKQSTYSYRGYYNYNAGMNLLQKWDKVKRA